jgi:hypothetical protein
MMTEHVIEVVSTMGWKQAHCKTCNWWAPTSRSHAYLAQKDGRLHVDEMAAKEESE